MYCIPRLWYILRDHNDRTALHIAAMRGSKQCVQYILQRHPKCINLFDKNQVSASFLIVVAFYVKKIQDTHPGHTPELTPTPRRYKKWAGAVLFCLGFFNFSFCFYTLL